MGQFIQTNGDYNIKVGDGKKIVLDTGPAAAGGSVVVTGDLVVGGETLTVAAVNLNITDNIIYLNDGEAGPGVTLVYSGIEIDRGDTVGSPVEGNASLVYDENTDAWIIAHGTSPGPFNYDNSNLRLKRILTSSNIENDGDLILIGSGKGVISVIGTDNYEDQITHDDDIPNKLYVDTAIQEQPTFQIVAPQSGDTRVIIADKDITPNNSSTFGSLAYFTAQTSYSTFGESAVSVIVDDSLIAQFYTNRLEVGDLEIGGGPERNEISSRTSITNQNVYVRTQGTGKLQTNYALQLERIGTSGEAPPLGSPYLPVTPAYVNGSTVIYAATPDIGTTGLWFSNDSVSEQYRTGEFISKNKALVFSMLF